VRPHNLILNCRTSKRQVPGGLKSRWRIQKIAAKVRFGSRLCGNSDLSIVRKDPTAQKRPTIDDRCFGRHFATPKDSSGWSFHTASVVNRRSGAYYPSENPTR
jgi:hypothetical protein